MAIFCLIVPFLVYLLTLCPTVFVGDSGELVTAVYTLGVPHPPGYPIFCVIGKIFTVLIPLSNIAYRVNLMSAVFASLSVLLVYLSIISVCGARGVECASRKPQARYLVPSIAFFSSLCFAFSATFWSQSIEAEVYSINAFFIVLIIYLLIKIIISPPKDYNYFFIAFICGLSLTNHHTTALLILVCAIYILYDRWTKHYSLKTNIKFFSPIIFFALIGLSLYIYLPLRSFTDPIIDWGNPDTFEKFTNHVVRRQYKGFSRQWYSLPLFFTEIKVIARFLLEEFTLFHLLFVVPAIIFLYKTQKKILVLLGGIFFVITSVIMYITKFIDTPYELYLVRVFFIPCYIIIGILAAVGIFRLFSRFLKIAVLTSAILCFVPLLKNYSDNNQSVNYVSYNYANNVLSTLSENAMLFSAGDDITFPLGYLKGVEEKRQDVAVYDRFGNVFKYIYGEVWLDKFQRDIRRVQVEIDYINAHEEKPVFYVTMGVSPSIGFPMKTIGLLYQLDKDASGVKDNGNIWRLYNMRGIEDKFLREDLFIVHVISQYYRYMGEYFFGKEDIENGKKEYEKVYQLGNNIGKLLVNLASAYSSKGFSDNAIYCLEQAIKIEPFLIEAYTGLGSIYGIKKEYKKAEEIFKKALEIEPFDAGIRNSLGITYMHTGGSSKAEAVFKQNIMLFPTYVESYNELGIIYASRNDLKGAVELWRKALQINPLHYNARSNLKRAENILNK